MKNMTRLSNLQLLVYEHSSRAAVAFKLDMTHSDFERFFTNKHLSVPENLARKIEDVFEKPQGWMDRKNFDLKLTTDEYELLEKYRKLSNSKKKIAPLFLELIENHQFD